MGQQYGGTPQGGSFSPYTVSTAAHLALPLPVLPSRRSMHPPPRVIAAAGLA